MLAEPNAGQDGAGEGLVLRAAALVCDRLQDRFLAGFVRYVHFQAEECIPIHVCAETAQAVDAEVIEGTQNVASNDGVGDGGQR